MYVINSGTAVVNGGGVNSIIIPQANTTGQPNSRFELSILGMLTSAETECMVRYNARGSGVNIIPIGNVYAQFASGIIDGISFQCSNTGSSLDYTIYGTI